jgi:hypothetical protein
MTLKLSDTVKVFLINLSDIYDFDNGLGYYPLKPTGDEVDTYSLWKSLSNYISPKTLCKVIPNKKISSMTISKFSQVLLKSRKSDLESLEDITKIQKSKYYRMHENMKKLDISEEASNTSSEIEEKNVINKEKVLQTDCINFTHFDMKENMKKLDISEEASIEEKNVINKEKVLQTDWINFTHFDMKYSFPVGSHALIVTAYSLDKSHLLLKTISENYKGNLHINYVDPTEIIGELQLSFLLFHYGQLYDGFEQWKTLTNLLCNCTAAITTHATTIFIPFIRTHSLTSDVLRITLEQFPKDFFIDELSSENFIRKAVNNLMHSVDDIGSCVVSECLDSLLVWVDEHFEWDVRLMDDEDAPVVVGGEDRLVDSDDVSLMEE